jgi:hypothetical protein
MPLEPCPPQNFESHYSHSNADRMLFEPVGHDLRQQEPQKPIKILHEGERYLLVVSSMVGLHFNYYFSLSITWIIILVVLAMRAFD